MSDEPSQPRGEEQAQPQGVFRQVFFAPGRCAVGFHNLISPELRKLKPGHWAHTAAVWTCSIILWLVGVLAVVLVLLAALLT